MSLARAFTTRRNRADKPSTGFLGRSASQRSPAKSSRPQISGPINLISSTNVLAYEAPNIAGTVPTPRVQHERAASSGSSTSSSRDSGEHSDFSSNSYRSNGSLTDASSVGSEPGSPEPNHLSCYFKPSVYTDLPDADNSESERSSVNATFDTPAIPQRAASHSKKAHMHISRQKSISRVSSSPSTATDFSRESTDFFRAEPEHPFGRELEQLNEVAEEFGGVARDAETDADLVCMSAHDLEYFSATDYMMEIADVLNTVFEDEEETKQEQDLAGWI